MLFHFRSEGERPSRNGIVAKGAGKPAPTFFLGFPKKTPEKEKSFINTHRNANAV